MSAIAIVITIIIADAALSCEAAVLAVVAAACLAAGSEIWIGYLGCDNGALRMEARRRGGRRLATSLHRINGLLRQALRLHAELTVARTLVGSAQQGKRLPPVTAPSA